MSKGKTIDEHVQSLINSAEMVSLMLDYIRTEKKEHLRMFIIYSINKPWYDQIIQFVSENESFSKLLPIAALDEYPIGFNKNPYENDPNPALNIFETLLSGIAYDGSDIEYGGEQKILMLNYFREFKELSYDMKLPDDVQSDKIPLYKSLIKMMLDNNISIDELSYTPEHINLIENIDGMPESATTLLHILYDDVSSDKCIPYGYKQFKRGMSMFYNLENPSKDELKEIVNNWTNKKVGFMFIVQYAHYSDYIDAK
jgi:hypothetical protein